MLGASGNSPAAIASELSIALVVAIVGGIIAYLLGKNGSAQAESSAAIVSTLSKQTDKLDSHGLSLAQLQTSLAPAVVELELLQIQTGEIGRDVAVLKEWRSAHDAWSKETIARLERGIGAQRRTDGP